MTSEEMEAFVTMRLRIMQLERQQKIEPVDVTKKHFPEGE